MKKSRPKVSTGKKCYAGLTAKEIMSWFEQIALIKAARDLNLFYPEFNRWRGTL